MYCVKGEGSSSYLSNGKLSSTRGSLSEHVNLRIGCESLGGCKKILFKHTLIDTWLARSLGFNVAFKMTLPILQHVLPNLLFRIKLELIKRRYYNRFLDQQTLFQLGFNVSNRVCTIWSPTDFFRLQISMDAKKQNKTFQTFPLPPPRFLFDPNETTDQTNEINVLRFQ